MYFILIRTLSFFWQHVGHIFYYWTTFPQKNHSKKRCSQWCRQSHRGEKARVLSLIGVLPSFAAGDGLWGGMFCTTVPMKNLKGRRVMHCKKCRRQSLPKCRCHRLIFLGDVFKKLCQSGMSIYRHMNMDCLQHFWQCGCSSRAVQLRVYTNKKIYKCAEKEESSIHKDEGSLAVLNIYFYFIALHLALIKT